VTKLIEAETFQNPSLHSRLRVFGVIPLNEYRLRLGRYKAGTCATLVGARHVPERLCGGPCLQRGAI